MIELLTAQPLTKAAIAEKAGWYTASGRPDTRRVELEVQRARLEGQPIVSDSDGYRLSSDPQEVAACARRLRSRLVSQAITARALRKTARRLAERAELTLFGQDIAA